VLVSADGQVVDEIGQLIDPEQPLTDEITKITGIKDSDLIGQPTLERALPVLRRAFAAADVMLTHNLPFDEGVLRMNLRRIGALGDWRWPSAKFCSVQLFRDEWGRNPRLIELYERKLSRPYPQTHRALDDARALAEVVIAEEL
jgi:DNA polymerase III epsilon subunit-like protein